MSGGMPKARTSHHEAACTLSTSTRDWLHSAPLLLCYCKLLLCQVRSTQRPPPGGPPQPEGIAGKATAMLGK